MIMLRKKLISILTILFISSTIIGNCEENKTPKLILGGNYIKEVEIEQEKTVDNDEEPFDPERFFRPSKLPVLNNKSDKFFYDLYGTDTSKVKIPERFLKTPKDTVINYFSVLREAANPLENTKTGCGTLGDAIAPYKIAYKFLSDSYKKKVSYNEFLKSFENILHINLIKANQLPPDKDKPGIIRYFVELETIEGSDESKGVFAYYFGYIDLKKEDGVYKIVNMDYTPENFLCAPYHGWSYDAQYVVEIEYGDWCHLVDGNVSVKQDGYEKKVYFKDKDSNEYYVLFYQLTDGVDIKIADYKKNKEGKWEQIYINPYDCIEKKNN